MIKFKSSVQVLKSQAQILKSRVQVLAAYKEKLQMARAKIMRLEGRFNMRGLIGMIKFFSHTPHP